MVGPCLYKNENFRVTATKIKWHQFFFKTLM